MAVVRSFEGVEPFPFVEFGFEIEPAFVPQKPTKFLLISSVRTLDSSVELWSASLDVGMKNALVLNMPMRLRRGTRGRRHSQPRGCETESSQ